MSTKVNTYHTEHFLRQRTEFRQSWALKLTLITQNISPPTDGIPSVMSTKVNNYHTEHFLRQRTEFRQSWALKLTLITQNISPPTDGIPSVMSTKVNNYHTEHFLRQRTEFRQSWALKLTLITQNISPPTDGIPSVMSTKGTFLRQRTDRVGRGWVGVGGGGGSRWEEPQGLPSLSTRTPDLAVALAGSHQRTGDTVLLPVRLATRFFVLQSSSVSTPQHKAHVLLPPPSPALSTVLSRPGWWNSAVLSTVLSKPGWWNSTVLSTVLSKTGWWNSTVLSNSPVQTSGWWNSRTCIYSYDQVRVSLGDGCLCCVRVTFFER